MEIILERLQKLENETKELKNELKTYSIEKIRFVINLSISNGWQGLFWDKYIESNEAKIFDPRVEAMKQALALSNSQAQ